MVSLNYTLQISLYYGTRKTSLHNLTANWTHSAIFSAFFAEPKSRPSAHLELRISIANSQPNSSL
jgi:hypothetical protein